MLQRKLLSIYQRLPGFEGVLSHASRSNQYHVSELSMKGWFSTFSVSCSRATSGDKKRFLSNLDGYDEDDLYSFDDDDHKPKRPSFRQFRANDDTENNQAYKPHRHSKFNKRGTGSQWTDSFTHFKGGRRPTHSSMHNDFAEHDTSSMSDLYQKVQSKGKTFQDFLTVEKNFYEEHPDVTSRNVDEIQEFQDKYEISITGSQKKRPIFKFEEVCFPEHIQSALKSMEFREPSPIQCIAWPHALSGCDIVGIAQTGSGKTLSFILPAIVHVLKQKQSSNKRKGPVALVICPTRELAMQVCQVAASLKRYCGISSLPVYGGQSKNVQIQNLQWKNPEIVVATPGRLMDLFSSNVISLDQVSYVVMDEADRMLDMGFEPQIRAIMDHIQPQRQVLMFSATWPDEVHEMARDYLHDYVHLKIGATQNTINPDVKQEFRECDQYLKDEELITQIQNISNGAESVKTLVFCARKITCEIVNKKLRRSGIPCHYIHGDCSQRHRDLAMRNFRNSRPSVLIATDIAARGIDVSDIELVINYDMPTNIDNYIHRVGRTARAGKKGNAVSFITENDFGMIKPLTRLLQDANQEVPRFFYTLDRQGRRLKSAKKSRNTDRFRVIHPRDFRF